MATKRSGGRTQSAVGARTSKRSKKQYSLKLKDLEARAGKKVKGGDFFKNCCAGSHYPTVIIS